MMCNSKLFYQACCSVLISLFLHPCHAQQEQGVALKFVSFPKTSDEEPLELLLSDSRTVAIKAPSNEVSKTHMVRAQRSWVIGKRVTDEDGNPNFKIYGKTQALASPKQLLVLIRKGPNNSDGFDIIALDGQKAKFNNGKFLFMNTANVGIAAVIGEQKIALQPGKHQVIKPEPNAGARKNLCHVSFAYRRNEDWKVFSSTMWPINKNARALVFFYQDNKTKRLRLHTIRDFM